MQFLHDALTGSEERRCYGPRALQTPGQIGQEPNRQRHSDVTIIEASHRHGLCLPASGADNGE